MPDTAIRESTHRVARAMVNSGFNRPNDRIVVNLAPAELPKQAATFDLPITLGILAGSGQVSTERLADYAVVGELSLEGSTRPTRGALSIAMAAARQKRECGLHGRPLKGVVVPTASATEAATNGCCGSLSEQQGKRAADDCITYCIFCCSTPSATSGFIIVGSSVSDVNFNT